MATFPQAVSQQPTQQDGAPPQAGGASPVIRQTMELAMLDEAIQGLAKKFPNAQDGIQMMMKGLRKVQASASASSGPQNVPAPPR